MRTDQQKRSQALVPRSASRKLLQAREILRFLLNATRRSAWRKLKNGIKVVLGRDLTFDEAGLFLRQYVLHLTGIQPIRKITCTGLRSEGAGSQALMILNAINFARSYGFEYVHTPFRFIRHAERPMEEWTAAWESLLNLGWGEPLCNDERRDVVDFCYNFPSLGRCFGCGWQWDELADRFKAMLPELRRKYYVNKSRGKTNQITVAVHIRRSDVSPDNPGYFTSNDTISRTIAAAQSALNARNVDYRIAIHSQGDKADFDDFSRLGVELFLDVDAVWTMQELVKADVLIMAKGCFSYCAALISDGIKIFQPLLLHNHNALPGWKWCAVAPEESWIACEPDGSFDSKAFERQLVLLMRAKATKRIDG